MERKRKAKEARKKWKEIRKKAVQILACGHAWKQNNVQFTIEAGSKSS